ncbi:AraC family transcriptional regulator [Spirosoma endbachense]|uniref:Helix-turn-helix domain-containing protein n=1 Tax=Spirosoma endbachense TaxID=2666025 RepID=A0A6P1W5E1_9BACT|nr:AraC family transcriptional regulator [Spirosoma endbachense]QHW00564.1 helix-turn-helix domain-containing protein [Spirosoma endbachense]
MKPQFYLVPRDVLSSHVSRHHILPNFGTIWHYHPELELHFIVRGEGVRFVGDNVSNFNAGELLLLGENLPHMWRCNEQYFRQDPTITAEAVVVQFLPDFMGQDFLQKPEVDPILHLYDKAKAGLVITGKTREALIPLMLESAKTSGLHRLVLILSMVDILTTSEEMHPISTKDGLYHPNKEETDRLNKVYNYALINYRRELTLEEIASVANLSVTSFCRYFKMVTKKTFHDFLIEIRISHAQRMLVEDIDITTEAVCFECGFNNRSNFFSHFKRITGITPFEYKRKCHHVQMPPLYQQPDN